MRLFPVRIAKTTDEKDKIYRFRYAIYHDEYSLIESNYDHEQKRLKDSIDDADTSFHFYMGSQEKIVCCCRVYKTPFNDLPAKEKGTYYINTLGTSDNISIAERLLVEKSRRGKYFVPALSHYSAYTMIAKEDTFFCVASCAPSLVKHYMQLGFRPFVDKVIQYEDRIEIPIAVIPDLSFLKKAGSAIYPMMKQNAPSDLLKQYDNYRSDVLSNFMLDPNDIERIMDFYPHMHEKSFLRHIKKKLLDYIMESSFIMHIDENHVLFDEIERQQIQFILLSGELHIYKQGVFITNVKPGEIIGEFGTYHDNYLRTVTVKASKPSVLLVLPRLFSLKLLHHDKLMYYNFMESFLKSLAIREKKIMLTIIEGNYRSK